MSSERSRLELLKHTFLKHPTPRFVSRTSVVAEILWKSPSFTSKHLSSPSFLGKCKGHAMQRLFFHIPFSRSSFWQKLFALHFRTLIAEASLGAILARNVFSQIWDFAPLALIGDRKWKNTWLYPQKTHISAKKNANIREKNANIQKNPPIHKWRLLRGEILVKIVALPVHKFNSVEHCVFAWASLWTWLANPLCPWFIMIPDQINSFRWFSSRWEPFLSRRKSDNRCWWNLWITEAKNPMLPSGNLLLFATYKPRPSRNSGFTQFYPASVRMVDLSIVFCKRVPGGSLPEAPWLIQSHLIPWQFAMVICHGPNWNRWFT